MKAKDIAEIKSLFKKCYLFDGLSDSELDMMATSNMIRKLVFAQSEFILREGEQAGEEFYIIASGEVEILKKSSSGEELYQIRILSVGETIGELALVNNSRTASARTMTDTTVFVLPFEILRIAQQYNKHYAAIKEQLTLLDQQLSKQQVYAKITLNLAKVFSERLLKTNLVTADTLRAELHLSQMRVAMGRFLIIIICNLTIYAYSLSWLHSFMKDIPSTTIVAVPMIVFFTATTVFFMLISPYPLSFYGLTLNNWRRVLLEGILWSLPMMLVIIFLKWLALMLISSNAPLFAGPDEIGVTAEQKELITHAAFYAYLCMVPLQELIVRGGLQSALQNFLVGKYRILLAILISNLIFSVAHLHISISLGIAVMILGIFWGFMYAHHKSLIGVSISHLIVGGWGLFFLGRL